MRGNAPSQR